MYSFLWYSVKSVRLCVSVLVFVCVTVCAFTHSQERKTKQSSISDSHSLGLRPLPLWFLHQSWYRPTCKDVLSIKISFSLSTIFQDYHQLELNVFDEWNSPIIYSIVVVFVCLGGTNIVPVTLFLPNFFAHLEEKFFIASFHYILTRLLPIFRCASIS